MSHWKTVQLNCVLHCRAKVKERDEAVAKRQGAEFGDDDDSEQEVAEADETALAEPVEPPAEEGIESCDAMHDFGTYIREAGVETDDEARSIQGSTPQVILMAAPPETRSIKDWRDGGSTAPWL